MISLFQISIDGDVLAFRREFPAEGEERLYRSEPYRAAGSWGSLLLQRLRTDGFYLVLVSFRYNGAVSVEIRFFQTLLVMLYNTGPAFSFTIEGAPRLCRRNSLSLFRLPAGVTGGDCARRGWYRFLLLFPPPLSSTPSDLPFAVPESIRPLLVPSAPLLFHTLAPLREPLPVLLYQIRHLPYVAVTRDYYTGLLRQLFLVFFRQVEAGLPRASSLSAYQEAAVYRVRAWIDAHPDQHLSLSQLARREGVNEFALKKGFAERFGCGVYQYLLRLRLERAREALEETEKPIRLIARQAGYRTASNFAAAFRRVYGMTPGQWRRRSFMNDE